MHQRRQDKPYDQGSPVPRRIAAGRLKVVILLVLHAKLPMRLRATRQPTGRLPALYRRTEARVPCSARVGRQDWPFVRGRSLVSGVAHVGRRLTRITSLNPRLAGLILLVTTFGCWQLGDPTSSDALVSWAAFPDTVIAGEVFSMEFAGPITPDACGRLDTATVSVTDSTVLLAARRVTYDTSCPSTPTSFYEARPLRLVAGTYVVLGARRTFGRIVAVDSGRFSLMRVSGEGTVRNRGGCTLFGPGRLGNQRPFALVGDIGDVTEALDADRIVWIRGTLSGFSLCGSFGSRPAIRVVEMLIRDGTSEDYYADTID